MAVLNYFAALSRGKMVLWCYLIWYLVTVYLRFDAAPAIWLNALGISAVIGAGLVLSVGKPDEPWALRRLFIMPFCVSSFSSLIKGRGYVLVFPSDVGELALSAAACVLFIAMVAALKLGRRSHLSR